MDASGTYVQKYSLDVLFLLCLHRPCMIWECTQLSLAVYGLQQAVVLQLLRTVCAWLRLKVFPRSSVCFSGYTLRAHLDVPKLLLKYSLQH